MEQLSLISSNDGDALYKLWVDKIIRHSKLVAALVNGPAVGIACTTLALCDVVLASDQAYFYCPFTQLGLNPEAASSYTFVHIMGYQKAVRLALLGEEMSAKEAHNAGLVTKVISHATFETETGNLISNYSRLAHQASASLKGQGNQ
ncbi:enoyl-CoA hydratase/isomerase family protein [Ancylostoma caninum]|uniref:Enoyl-CoA hydratase/isomerase family protein n=1 Tax=Ancylostoma caninum TaxID=29170 RepID=A0A368GJ37_ANCCA|nr:enoyl-CoA hydratase/isomerase family protein [Ancylostoma caninum]